MRNAGSLAISAHINSPKLPPNCIYNQLLSATEAPNPADQLHDNMAASNIALNRKYTDARRPQFSPDLAELALARRITPYSGIYRQDSEGLMSRLKPTFVRTTSGHGSRTHLFGLLDLKESLRDSKQRPKTIMHDKERLYEDILILKAENNQLKTLNLKLSTKMSQLEQEIDRRDLLLKQISVVTEEKHLAGLVAETHLVAGLKQTVKQLRAELLAKEVACNQLKRSIKLTKNAELEAEAKEYFSECQRLKALCTKTDEFPRSDSTLHRENTELRTILAQFKRENQEFAEKVRELEREIALEHAKEDQVQGKQREIADLRLEVAALNADLEQKAKEKQDTVDTFMLRIREMEERWRMAREEVATWEALQSGKIRKEIENIKELQEIQARELEQDRKEGVGAVRDMCLRILKRKAVRKRVNFEEIFSSATVLTAKSLKNALKSAGIKIHKWQISGLFSPSETLKSEELLSDYNRTPAPRDLQSTVAQPSYQSDTFSLTSNPFEVADGSKRFSSFRPPVSSLIAHESSSSGKTLNSLKSQPCPTSNPAEDQNSPETPLFPTETSPQGLDLPQFPPEEIPEEPYAYEDYRHDMYTEPGRDLMSIAEVRKSLSTDSWDEHKGDGGVILLNIDEGRVAKTFQSIRLHAQLHHLTPSDMKRKLAAHFTDKQLSIDHLKCALQGDQLQVKDEADAIAAAAYLLGHRQGLADTQKLEQVEMVNFAELGEWEVLTDTEEAELKPQFEDLLSTLTWAELESVDIDSTGKITFQALRSLCDSHNFPISASLLLYIELRSFTVIREVGVFPYARFYPKSREKAAALAKDCAQHLGIELLIQGLSVSEAFRQGMTREEFMDKVESLGLEELEGAEELLDKVIGTEGLQLAALEKELEEFQSQ